MRTPTTIRAGVDVVSKDESDGEEVESIGRRATCSYRSRNWISRIQELTRTGRNGACLPPVGRFCLILKGDADKDVGRMALVTRQTKKHRFCHLDRGDYWSHKRETEASGVAYPIGINK
jgi:hypothetical protein